MKKEQDEMVMRHREELWTAVVAEWPRIDIAIMVGRQRNEWGELLKRIEQDKKS